MSFDPSFDVSWRGYWIVVNRVRGGGDSCNILLWIIPVVCCFMGSHGKTNMSELLQTTQSSLLNEPLKYPTLILSIVFILYS